MHVAVVFAVGAVIKALESHWGQENSDPSKVAQVILRLAASDRLPAHLLLGSDAVRHSGEAEPARAAEADRWREISVSTDVNISGSLQLYDSERPLGTESQDDLTSFRS